MIWPWGTPPVPRLVLQTGMNEKHCIHVIWRTNYMAHTFDHRRRQGRDRFENGVLINQEGLAARSTEHTGFDVRNLGVTCIRKEVYGDLPRPVTKGLWILVLGLLEICRSQILSISIQLCCWIIPPEMKIWKIQIRNHLQGTLSNGNHSLDNIVWDKGTFEWSWNYQ